MMLLKCLWLETNAGRAGSLRGFHVHSSCLTEEDSDGAGVHRPNETQSGRSRTLHERAPCPLVSSWLRKFLPEPASSILLIIDLGGSAQVVPVACCAIVSGPSAPRHSIFPWRRRQSGRSATIARAEARETGQCQRCDAVLHCLDLHQKQAVIACIIRYEEQHVSVYAEARFFYCRRGEF